MPDVFLEALFCLGAIEEHVRNVRVLPEECIEIVRYLGVRLNVSIETAFSDA